MTRAEWEAETATIITAVMERTGNTIMEVRQIYMAEEIATKVGRVTRTTAYNVGHGLGCCSGSEHEGTGSAGLVIK